MCVEKTVRLHSFNIVQVEVEEMFRVTGSQR